MAKRKGARTSSRKRTVARSGRASSAGRKRVAKKKSAAGRRTAAAGAKKKTAAKRSQRTTSAARSAKPRKKSAVIVRRKPAAAARRRPVAAKATVRAAKTTRTAKRKPPVRQTKPVAVKKTPVVARKAPVVARKAPALERTRRTISDIDMVPMPPSTLDLDRTASSARSGRRGLRDRFAQHTETSPALTGGDVDADWESAYSVGDEAPGGDSPTPDQDIVDDIGRAVGVEYQDNEELKGDEKIVERDRHRWELDPASAEDYDEH